MVTVRRGGVVVATADVMSASGQCDVATDGAVDAIVYGLLYMYFQP